MSSLFLGLVVAALLVTFIPSSDAVKSCYKAESLAVTPVQAACPNSDTYIFCFVLKILYFVINLLIN